MKRPKWFVCYACVLVLIAVGCTVREPVDQEADLHFEAHMEVNSKQEFHVSLGVQNQGPIPFAGDESFNGEMALSYVDGNRAGELRARAETTSLARLDPDETNWPLTYRCRLDSGTYSLTWGAEGYGATTVEFEIVERDGRLYLGPMQAVSRLSIAAAWSH